MSENEDTTSAENRERRKQLKKAKKRKRNNAELPGEQEEPKTSRVRSDGVEENDDEVVEKKPKEPSKRQLKREKAEQKLSEQREASKLEATQKALTYISKWKHAKSDWKFEKLRQIWLMDHLLDDSMVPDSIFPTVMEYFEGCKGMARQQLVKKMMVVIKKVEEIKENEENEESGVTNTTEYQRARQILQVLPTEA